MARVEALVQLTDQLIAELDAEAGRRGISRSALIREAVEAHLADSREAELTRRIVEGYRRVPPATPDEWGDLQRQADVTTVETMRRLDIEERERGASW
jgi:hypothetical protein